MTYLLQRMRLQWRQSQFSDLSPHSAQGSLTLTVSGREEGRESR